MSGWRKCAFGCRGSVMFKFPNDETIRQKWSVFVFGEISPRNAFVCARHFTDDCFMNKDLYESGRISRLSLKSTAIPTIKDVPPLIKPEWWSEEPVVIPTKRSVGTQLSAGTLRYHRSKGIQATDKSIRKGTSILEQIGQIQSSAAVNRANHESDKGPAAKRICVKEEEEEEHISDPLLPHNSMYEPRDSDASDQSDLESEYGDAKYIVSASSLRELFERCPICTKHCKVKRRRRGLLLSFSQTCPHCSYRRRWQSQMEELLEVPVTEDQSENENSDCENPSKEILAAHVFINQRGSYQNQNRLGQNTTEYSP
ncbi:uncharacterized protein LOC110161145 isoform X3 [Boleophthalmus pectinirostris]|uniref:uncharacterized protein LOC110161145 isoform X3 n=1 Tax=Boleophthalmus pectinirostris TaxID=150288 RepID=UPI000A1C6AB9|nr:uncharacterized protein LOC110161145 isoform X3 [Boleophthalmus pectinirostris]